MSGVCSRASGRDPLEFTKFPVLFPDRRELPRGDRFDGGCIHHHAVRCEPAFPGLRQIARNLRAVSRVQIRDVRSLLPAEVAIASILAAGLWALQTRSWRRTELHMKTARIKSTNRASRIGGSTPEAHCARHSRPWRAG